MCAVTLQTALFYVTTDTLCYKTKHFKLRIRFCWNQSLSRVWTALALVEQQNKRGRPVFFSISGRCFTDLPLLLTFNTRLPVTIWRQHRWIYSCEWLYSFQRPASLMVILGTYTRILTSNTCCLERQHPAISKLTLGYMLSTLRRIAQSSCLMSDCHTSCAYLYELILIPL